MNIEAWKSVDRFEVLAAIRAICGESGARALLVRGDEESGLMTVADLACAFLDDIGFRPIRVRPVAGKATLINDLLGSAWRRVDGPAPLGAVPRSVSEARHMSSASLIQEVAACPSVAGEQVAFVFDVVDPEGRVPRAQMALFADLARGANVPVIVFSRAESNSELPRTLKVVEVGDMELLEVRTTLRTADAFLGYDPADVTSLYAQVERLSSNSTTVCPVDAYDVLEQRLREMDGA